MKTSLFQVRHAQLGSLRRSQRGEEPPLNRSLLLHGCAGGLLDHIDHDVRESDGDGVRRVQLNDVRVGTIGFELEFFLGNDGIEQGPDLPARLARPCSRCQWLVEGCQG